MEESREAEIIREVLLGDAQAFEALVRKYQGPVYNLMLRKVGDVDVAADLSQEAFLRAYLRLETFTLGKRFFPWLYSVSMNVARDWFRKKGLDLHLKILQQQFGKLLAIRASFLIGMPQGNDGLEFIFVF